VRQAAAFLLLTLAFAAASVLGWWAIPATAALWGILHPIARRPALFAAAAALAWSGWLLADGLSPRGDFSGLAVRLGGIFSLPAPALVAITIVFAALLAGSAAYLAVAIAPARKS